MDVDTVLVDGEVVLRDGAFVKLDENEILRQLVASAEEEPSALQRRWSGVLEELKPHVVRFYSSWDTPAQEPCYTVNSMN
jgi:hypothetical protein